MHEVQLVHVSRRFVSCKRSVYEAERAHRPSEITIGSLPTGVKRCPFESGQVMSDTTVCAKCGVIGFVRREKVIQGSVSVVRYYCGSCNRSWDTPEPSVTDPSKPPAGRTAPEP